MASKIFIETRTCEWFLKIRFIGQAIKVAKITKIIGLNSKANYDKKWIKVA